MLTTLVIIGYVIVGALLLFCVGYLLYIMYPIIVMPRKIKQEDIVIDNSTTEERVFIYLHSGKSFSVTKEYYYNQERNRKDYIIADGIAYLKSSIHSVSPYSYVIGKWKNREVHVTKDVLDNIVVAGFETRESQPTIYYNFENGIGRKGL